MVRIRSVRVLTDRRSLGRMLASGHCIDQFATGEALVATPSTTSTTPTLMKMPPSIPYGCTFEIRYAAVLRSWFEN